MKEKSSILLILFYFSLFLFLFHMLKENYPSTSFLNANFILIVVNFFTFVAIAIRYLKKSRNAETNNTS